MNPEKNSRSVAAPPPREAQVDLRKLRLPGNIAGTPWIFPAHLPGARARRAARGRRPGWARAPGRTGTDARARTPGSRHQLKAVKVNEGGRGAGHSSLPAHKGGFLTSRMSSHRRTPAGASHRGVLTSDPPSGPRLSPEAPPAQARQEVAKRKPPTWTAPSPSSASRPAAVCAQLQRSDLRD